MRGWERYASVTLLSITIAAALSLLPGEGAIGTLASMDSGILAKVKLTDDNLVECLAELPKQMELRRVSIHSPVLSVDYHVKPGLREEDILRDLANLSRFAIEGTTNIEEIQARVYSDDSWESGPPLLLASLNTRRKEAGDLRKLPKDAEGLRNLLTQQCRLAFTRKGLERISSMEGM